MMGTQPNTPAEVWSRVATSDTDACWPWLGATRKGYGHVRYQGQQWSAHRLAYVLARGPIPTGMLVCHACDNPLCCNPQHLWLGTNRENILDSVTKGRHVQVDLASLSSERRARGMLHGMHTHPESRRRGEHNGSAKLTTDQVIQIREQSARGLTQRQLAREYGICQATVRDIVLRKKWQHVPTRALVAGQAGKEASE